jgi:hypothetical protein
MKERAERQSNAPIQLVRALRHFIRRSISRYRGMEGVVDYLEHYCTGTFTRRISTSYFW